MSEAKFTKGPWRIGGTGPNGCVPVGTIEGLMVCQTAHSIYGDSQEERGQAIGNAHLIAAAPEMYELLELALSLMDGDSIEDFTYQYQEIVQLLAKARGEK